MSTTTPVDADTSLARRPITTTHLELDERGRAWIKGANTKVIEVVLDWLTHRSSPEEMHYQYPHLSLAQIHAALSYYFDHQESFDAEIARQEAEIEALRTEAGESPVVNRLRDLGKLP